MADIAWDGPVPNKQSPVPLYYQLAEAIETRIAARDWQPGDRLPAERDLAAQAGISRMTARQALNGEPVLLETSHFPHALCAGIEHHDLTHRSFYALLDTDYGIRLTHARQTVEAVAANAFESGLFGIEPGSPLLLLAGVASTSDGLAGEYFKAAYRGDRFKFALRAADSETEAAGAALPIGLVLT